MLNVSPFGIYQSTLLLSVKEIVHGYSSRRLGDMRKREAREKFLSLLPGNPARVVFAEQVHGNTIQIISGIDGKKEIPQTDGLVSKRNGTLASLAVRIADCVPILAVDQQALVIGAAHAGWKGTLGGIAIRLIETMKTSGADSKRILVSIGPHIGMCCYSVPEDRARTFTQVFHHDPAVVSSREGHMYVDLGYANYLQLVKAGILPQHIDAAISCTSCQVDTFFSFRRDTKETFGKMLGVIGWKA